MKDFTMPLFPDCVSNRINCLDLLLELSVLSTDNLSISDPEAPTSVEEEAFDTLVPKMLIDGEEFAVDGENRSLAVYIYAQSKAVGHHSFRMTREMRENFIDYLGRDLAWEVFVHPYRYPLHALMLRKSADVEVVVRQPADA